MLQLVMICWTIFNIFFCREKVVLLFTSFVYKIIKSNMLYIFSCHFSNDHDWPKWQLSVINKKQIFGHFSVMIFTDVLVKTAFLFCTFFNRFLNRQKSIYFLFFSEEQPITVNKSSKVAKYYPSLAKLTTLIY